MVAEFWTGSARDVTTGCPQGSPLCGWSATREMACPGLLLGKKRRPGGRILRVAEIAQADTNEAKPPLRAEADAFP